MNKIQAIQLELIKLSSFNGFDGEEVVQSLIENQDLWEGVVMDRAYHPYAREMGGCNLIKLRDIKSGYWNVDTLFIKPVSGKETELKGIARTWKADEIDWIGGEDACHMLGSYSPKSRDNKKQILRIWWD